MRTSSGFAPGPTILFLLTIMHRATTAITIIRHALHGSRHAGRAIAVSTDRWQLAKHRWRATATDGRDFGFELDHPMQHGDVILENDYGHYVIEQAAEPVLVFSIGDATAAATLAWSIGNLHQPLQVTADELVASDDPALRQWCDQQQVPYRNEQRIFQPIRAASGHHRHHHH